MIDYILNPNLPQGSVKKIICGTKDKLILDFFTANGIEVLYNDENINIDSAVSTHADMAALHLGGNNIILDKAQFNLKSSLVNGGFNVTETSTEITGEYPFDITLNFALIGNYAVGNFRHADSNLNMLLSDKKQINVKQGYCKCSLLIVSENAVITDDTSIYHKMLENEFDALLISKGDVSLQGHEYGFIGGASGKIAKDTVVFFGDASMHRDFEKIDDFLTKHDCRYICSDKNKLRDIGGIIPLIESI